MKRIVIATAVVFLKIFVNGTLIAEEAPHAGQKSAIKDQLVTLPLAQIEVVLRQKSGSKFNVNEFVKNLQIDHSGKIFDVTLKPNANFDEAKILVTGRCQSHKKVPTFLPRPGQTVTTVRYVVSAGRHGDRMQDDGQSFLAGPKKTGGSDPVVDPIENDQGVPAQEKQDDGKNGAIDPIMSDDEGKGANPDIADHKSIVGSGVADFVDPSTLVEYDGLACVNDGVKSNDPMLVGVSVGVDGDHCHTEKTVDTKEEIVCDGEGKDRVCHTVTITITHSYQVCDNAGGSVGVSN